MNHGNGLSEVDPILHLSIPMHDLAEARRLALRDELYEERHAATIVAPLRRGGVAKLRLVFRQPGSIGLPILPLLACRWSAWPRVPIPGSRRHWRNQAKSNRVHLHAVQLNAASSCKSR